MKSYVSSLRSIEKRQKSDVHVRKMKMCDRIIHELEDGAELEKSRSSIKCRTAGTTPPWTANFWQHTTQTDVRLLHGILQHELKICDANDAERATILENVVRKCEALKHAFAESDMMVRDHYRQKAAHRELMTSWKNDIRVCVLGTKKMSKAAKKLEVIHAILTSVCCQNQLYSDFLEDIAQATGNFESAHALTGRYDELLSARADLKRCLNESLKKLEETKRAVASNNFGDGGKHQKLLRQLAAVDCNLNAIKTNTLRHEQALTNVNIETIDIRKETNSLLRSVQDMVERLINEHHISPKYRCMTLAQQLDAVRESYLRKKEVIRTFQKVMESKHNKENRRCRVYSAYEKNLLNDCTVENRLHTLNVKKKTKALKAAESRYLKRLRRIRSRTHSMFIGEFSKSGSNSKPADQNHPFAKRNVKRKVENVKDDLWDEDEEIFMEDLAHYGDGIVPHSSSSRFSDSSEPSSHELQFISCSSSLSSQSSELSQFHLSIPSIKFHKKGVKA